MKSSKREGRDAELQSVSWSRPSRSALPTLAVDLPFTWYDIFYAAKYVAVKKTPFKLSEIR